MASQKPDRTRGRITKVLKSFVLHPLGHFLIFLLFLYQVKEFYPFTHVPMYSDPEAGAPYLYLCDGEGNALGVKSHAGITNPKMRKMYRSRMGSYCEEHGFDKAHPPEEAVDEIGGQVVTFLRKHAIGRNNPLPDTVRLMHVLIEPAPDGFKETENLLYEHRIP
jgi:hypothetical protein